MIIIASTKDGYLIQATTTEVEVIMKALSKPSSKENPIKIGDKVPAFDYAEVVRNCVNFKDNFNFERFKEYANKVMVLSNEVISGIESLGGK